MTQAHTTTVYAVIETVSEIKFMTNCVQSEINVSLFRVGNTVNESCFTC